MTRTVLTAAVAAAVAHYALPVQPVRLVIDDQPTGICRTRAVSDRAHLVRRACRPRYLLLPQPIQ